MGFEFEYALLFKSVMWTCLQLDMSCEHVRVTERFNYFLAFCFPCSDGRVKHGDDHVQMLSRLTQFFQWSF
jgi:hypothetical protein